MGTPRTPPRRKKGTPKTGGRKKGTPNKATVEAKIAASEIVDDPKYRKKLLTKARKGTLPPAVECMLWHYAKGKPKDSVELSGGLADLTDTARAKIEAEVRAMGTEEMRERLAEYDRLEALQVALMTEAKAP
jgi:hypothetical protein